MAKVYSDGRIPKRIENVVIYPMHGKIIARTISGFTSEKLGVSPKYLFSRQNASEFGRLSSECKLLRMALVDLLPKQNNLAVVNAFTRIMRTVMVCDGINARGERNLASVLESIAGKKLLMGYNFNPDSAIDLHYFLKDYRLVIDARSILFPKEANCIGFRMHVLVFDFLTKTHILASGDWALYGNTTLADAVVLKLPAVNDANGVAFTLLELHYYDYNAGTYIPMDDRSKAVLIVGVDLHLF
jgi:hypothetical protein